MPGAALQETGEVPAFLPKRHLSEGLVLEGGQVEGAWGGRLEVTDGGWIVALH